MCWTFVATICNWLHVLQWQKDAQYRIVDDDVTCMTGWSFDQNELGMVQHFISFKSMAKLTIHCIGLYIIIACALIIWIFIVVELFVSYSENMLYNGFISFHRKYEWTVCEKNTKNRSSKVFDSLQTTMNELNAACFLPNHSTKYNTGKFHVPFFSIEFRRKSALQFESGKFSQRI